MQRELHHEPGAPSDGVFAPDVTAVQPHVLGHQREPEAGALARGPLPGPPAPVEALEEVLTLVLGHPGAVVLDEHPDGGGG